MSFPRYPEYKDSGVKTLGGIPSHWKMGKVKNILSSMGSGGTPDTAEQHFWSENNGTSWVAIGDMSNREYIESTEKSLTKEGIESKGLTIWPPGTLLFSMYASLGHVAELGIAAATNQAILSLVPKAGIEQSFLKRWFEYLRPQLKEHASSNTQDNLNAEKVRNLMVVVPPSAEQACIANFLDSETAKIDALVAEQEKLMALLKEKRQAVISHVVTKGLDPNVPMKDSGVEWLGEVPAHWGTPPLYLRYSSELGKMLDTSRIKGEHLVPYLRNTDVQWGRINFDDLPQMDIEAAEYQRYTIQAGDLLICEGGEVGRAAQVECVQGVVGYQKALHRLRALSSKEISGYMYYVFVWAAHSGLFTMNGSSTIAHLTGQQLRKYRFPKPPADEQADIVQYLLKSSTQLDGLIDEAQSGINLLQERCSSLISAAVTGKIDVRGAAKALAA